MTITNFDQLINAMANSSESARIQKASIANATAGQPMSLWRATGFPAQGAIPTTAAVCTKSLLGAIGFTDSVDPVATYLARSMLISSNTGTDVQYHDRLMHRGGLDGNITTLQTVGLDATVTTSNMVARKGAADYSDVQWWIEIYTDIGTTARNVNVNYTDANGVARVATVSIGSTTNSANRAGRLIPIFPITEANIRSIESVQIQTGGTGTVGNFGVTATVAITGIALGLGNAGTVANFAQLGMPRIRDQSCIMLIVFPGTTSTGTLYGTFKFIQG